MLPQKFVVEIEAGWVDTILRCLAKGIYEDVAAPIAAIRIQVTEQIEAAREQAQAEVR